jgi:HAD superfamily hydrolase (TIGR01549 family)
VSQELKPGCAVSDGFEKIDAITFDFYNTLVYHREGSGRGAMLMGYLQAHGLQSDPWEHQVLYDVFERHDIEYTPSQPDEEKPRYFLRFAARVFQRLHVRAPDSAVVQHAANVWSLLGPESLGIFPDVLSTVKTLTDAGYPLAVVSNWQCGLGHFVTELGLGPAFDHVLASAEVGSVKPDPEIFNEACRLLSVPSHRVLHVGDSMVDDIDGACGAGLHPVLLSRDGHAPELETPTIPSLDRIPQLLGLVPS